MTTELQDQSQAYIQAFAQVVAERVAEKIIQSQKEAVVIFTASDIDIAQSLEALRVLREEGFSYHVLLTYSAEAILDRQAIQSALQPKNLWIDKPGQERLAYSYDTIIVPTLTVNTLAHLANCLTPSPAMATILSGVMRGKNVIATINGCCPDNETRANRGYILPEPLKEKLRTDMKTLASFGVKLCTADRLAERTRKAILPQFGVAQPSTLPSTRTALPSGLSPQEYTGGKVLSAGYLATCPPHTVLALPQGTLVTQMAQDEARRRNITLGNF